MKRFIQLTVAIFIFGNTIFAQETHDMSKMNMEMRKDKPMALLSDAGFVHHPVSTKNKEAQKLFQSRLDAILRFQRR